MSLFKQVYQKIKTNKERKEQGLYNSIPFGVPALDRHTPGIMGGLVYCITANSGVGKTQLTKYLFVLQAYRFIKENPNVNLKLKIIYFALEESKEDFLLTLICNRLYQVYRIKVTTSELRSLGENQLTDDVLDKIKETEVYFEDFLGCIDIVDECYNPTGMLKHCKNYALNNGTAYYESIKNPGVVLDHVEYYRNKEIQEDYRFSHYVQDDPEEIRVVVTDHISLVETERGAKDLHEAISLWSTNYCRKTLAKSYNFCVAMIHQQSGESDKQQFSLSGDTIINKLLPSLSNLGDNKLVGRDYFIVLGLFAPERYQIKKYLGYNIGILQDKFRSLIILKNRLGTPNLQSALMFNGSVNEFKELPPPESREMKSIYEQIN